MLCTSGLNEVVDGQEVKRARTDEEKAAAIDEAKAEKLSRILAGTITQRGGGARLSPYERILRDVAERFVRAQAHKKGASLPTGADLTKLVEKASAFASVIAEAKEQFARLDAIEIGEGEDLF